MVRIDTSTDIDAAVSHLIGRAYQEARGECRGVLMSLTRAVSDYDPLDAFARGANLMSERFFWEQASEGFSLAGIGAAHVIAPEGVDRFAAAAAARRALLSGAVIDDASDGAPGTGPLLTGGFSFDPAAASSGRWEGFPDAMLVLPRLLLTRGDSQCWLTVNAVIWPDSEPVDEVRRLVGEIDCLLGSPRGAKAAALRGESLLKEVEDDSSRFQPGSSSQRGGSSPAWGWPVCSSLEIDEIQSPVEWKSSVADAARAACDGVLEKVVLAREVQVRGDEPYDVPVALDWLRTTYPACYVFAVARGERVFLGATPERLVRREGEHVRATCLAGSIRRGSNQDEDQRLGADLLASSKDRVEHEIVVRALREGLDSLCDQIDAPPEPRLLTFSNVHHLYTPVTARLRPDHCLLELVGALHPTPAVGGFPREDAMQFIREREGLDRGWYASPVGWLDNEGSGEFAVALRSALVDGADASLFAGCGIVGDSDSEQEYAESWLKLRPMLGALEGRTE